MATFQFGRESQVRVHRALKEQEQRLHEAAREAERLAGPRAGDAILAEARKVLALAVEFSREDDGEKNPAAVGEAR